MLPLEQKASIENNGDTVLLDFHSANESTWKKVNSLHFIQNREQLVTLQVICVLTLCAAVLLLLQFFVRRYHFR